MPEDIRLVKSHQCDYETGHAGEHHSGVGMGEGYFWGEPEPDERDELIATLRADLEAARLASDNTVEQAWIQSLRAANEALKAKAALADEVLAEDGLRWALCADEAGTCTDCGTEWGQKPHHKTCIISRYDALTQTGGADESRLAPS
jgi:hypothetical protein